MQSGEIAPAGMQRRAAMFPRRATWILPVITGLVVLALVGPAGAQTQPPEVTTRALRIGEAGLPYFATLTAAGGTQPHTWTLDEGMLPPGLMLVGSIGVVAGTPTSPGTYSFSVTVTDRAGQTDTQALMIPIGMPVTIDTSSLPAGETTRAYSRALTVFGGVAPYTWSIAEGRLQAGLALDESTGVISGTPGDAGTERFVARVRDGVGGVATRALSITIDVSMDVAVNPSPALDIATLALPTATAGGVYAQRLQATGGTPPLAWEVIAGRLPEGLTLDSATGVLTGTPTSGDEAVFVVLVRDASGAHAGVTLRLVTEPAQTTDLAPWVRAVCAADFAALPSVNTLCALYMSGQVAEPARRTIGRAILELAR